VIENVEIDAELWSEPWVDIMHSTLIGKNADISRCYKIAPLDSDFLLEHAWDEDEKPVAVETAFMFADITVATAELFQLLSPPPDTIVEQKSKGGRPAKYDWQGFWTELVVRADLDDLPDTQAGCVRVMASWCLEKWDNEPTDSLLREKIAPIYNHPRKKIN